MDALDFNFEPNRKDRDSLIKKTNEQEVVGSMFPFSLDAHPNFIMYDESTSIWETKKFFIFTSSKGGSTITQRLLKLLDPKYNTRNKNIEEIFFQVYNGFVNFNKKYDNIDESVKELNLALNGKSKKDIIFVTRNPVAKFFSGVIQDVSTDIPTFLPQFMKLDHNGYDITAHPQNFIENLFSNKVNIDIEHKMDIMGKIVSSFLKGRYQRKGTCVIGHSKSYNELYNKIIDCNPNIDKTKLWFIDIDNPKHDLVKVFQKYYPDIKLNSQVETVWTHRPKWDSVFGELNTYLDNKEHKQILISITKEVLNDYYYYKLLQVKYNKNFNLL